MDVVNVIKVLTTVLNLAIICCDIAIIVAILRRWKK